MSEVILKKQRNWQLMALLVVVVLIASGCVSYDASGQPYGAVYEYLGKPAAAFLDFLAGFLFNSYGLAIIIVTLLTRVFMLPSSLKMTRDTMISQARMKVAQPEINEIQEEINASKDPAERARLQQELMGVYKKYNINMLGGLSGCLPLLLQMPVISAVYAAIRTSTAIQNSTFLGIQLGQRSTLIVILVVAVSILQSWLMQKQMPSTPGNEKAGQTSQVMFWMNPILFGWMTWTTDAGLGLYFLAGAVFMIGQQLYTNHVVKPKIQEIIDQDMANVQVTPRRPRKDVTAQATKEANRNRLVPTKESVGAASSKRRNAGKQTRR